MREFILKAPEIYATTIKEHNLQEVIRCKDCKWFAHDDDCYGDCSNEGGVKEFVYTTDYCSRAERKENDRTEKQISQGQL